LVTADAFWCSARSPRTQPLPLLGTSRNELEPDLGSSGSTQLLFDVFAGAYDRPLGGCGHILDRKFLTNDQPMVTDQLSRHLMHVVLARIGNRRWCLAMALRTLAARLDRYDASIANKFDENANQGHNLRIS
jgi:hypothetical protein